MPKTKVKPPRPFRYTCPACLTYIYVPANVIATVQLTRCTFAPCSQPIGKKGK